MKQFALFILTYTMWLTAMAQPLCHVTYYDEEDGLPHSHVTQLLQDVPDIQTTGR